MWLRVVRVVVPSLVLVVCRSLFVVRRSLFVVCCLVVQFAPSVVCCCLLVAVRVLCCLRYVLFGYLLVCVVVCSALVVAFDVRRCSLFVCMLVLGWRLMWLFGLLDGYWRAVCFWLCFVCCCVCVARCVLFAVC